MCLSVGVCLSVCVYGYDCVQLWYVGLHSTVQYSTQYSTDYSSDNLHCMSVCVCVFMTVVGLHSTALNSSDTLHCYPPNPNPNPNPIPRPDMPSSQLSCQMTSKTWLACVCNLFTSPRCQRPQTTLSCQRQQNTVCHLTHTAQTTFNLTYMS